MYFLCELSSSPLFIIISLPPKVNSFPPKVKCENRWFGKEFTWGGKKIFARFASEKVTAPGKKHVHAPSIHDVDLEKQGLQVIGIAAFSLYLNYKAQNIISFWVLYQTNLKATKQIISSHSY